MKIEFDREFTYNKYATFHAVGTITIERVHYGADADGNRGEWQWDVVDFDAEYDYENMADPLHDQLAEEIVIQTILDEI